MRLRTLTIALTLIVLASGLLAAPAFAKDPSISTLRQRLERAQAMSRRAHERVRAAAADLAGAREIYAAISVSAAAPDPAATPDAAANAVTADEVAALQKRLTTAKRVAHRWDVRVRQVKRRLRRLKQIVEWNRRGQWKPLIAIAAAKYRVSRAGLHRMMMLESGGHRTAGATFKGLFQYHPSTWTASWNPWRHESIYNGWAQIRATAYAVSRGMGPGHWPNTYPMAF